MDEELTLLIRAAADGNKESQEKAAILVYQELKKTAEWLMKNKKSDTIQPTALVNQVIVKLFNSDKIAEAPNRKYFFGAAARSMRQILVDEAKRRKAQKRGGEFNRQPFDQILEHYEREGVDIVSLNEAIELLENLHQRQANVVHLKWFLVLSNNQIAEALEISVTTVESDWRAAKAFLFRQLEP